jgi:hypothetical protein
LLAHGEEVPGVLVVSYCEALLRTANGAKARQVVKTHRTSLSPREAVNLGWICYRLGADDLAYGLLLAGLPDDLHNVKLLSTLERTAVRCRRVDDLVAAYAPLAASAPALHGRIKSLLRRRDR